MHGRTPHQSTPDTHTQHEAFVHTLVVIMQNKFLGLLLAVLGNSFIGLSFSTVKYAHVTNVHKVPYIRLKWWWVGTCLMGLGELGNLLAYAVAKPALVSPLGAVSVLVNAPCAYLVLGEKLAVKNAIGGILCILGGVGIVHVVASQATDNAFLTADEFETLCMNPAFLVFLVAILVESIELVMSKRKSIVVYVLICSFLGAVTVLCIKGLSSFVFLTLRGENQFWHPLPWLLVPVLGGTVTMQIHYLNMSMAEFGTGEVVPVYYVLFTGCAVLGSAMLYRDLDGVAIGDALVFLVSIVCTSIGVYLVAHKDTTADAGFERLSSTGDDGEPVMPLMTSDSDMMDAGAEAFTMDSEDMEMA